MVTWFESMKEACWTPRHAMPVVVHNGRIFVLGGDQNSGAYQPDVCSWDGTEDGDGWRTDCANAPWGNRAGHWAFSFGGYLWVGGGQTLSTISGTPTKFFRDAWRSQDGAEWEEYDDGCPIGIRGYLSSNPVEFNGDIYIIAGGTYTTSDFPTREYKSSVFKMTNDGDDHFSFHEVFPENGKVNNLPAREYHNLAVWDNKLWVVCGYNGDNMVSVQNSEDGKVWNSVSVPWSARHAAILLPFGDSLYFGTGVNNADMWRIYKPDYSKYHFGAPVDGTTGINGPGSFYTYIDKTIELSPGDVIDKIGISRQTAGTVYLSVVKHSPGSNVFDFVATTGAVYHAGGGERDFDISNYTVPDDGYEYRLSVAQEYPYADSFGFTGVGRWMKPGIASGAGQSFTYYANGSFPMYWIEE